MPTDDLSSHQRTFRGHVRRALLHLYDPASLRRSPLLDLLGIPNATDRVFATREVIQKAIQALKPDRSAGGPPTARQIYQILNYRYLEQMGQKEVAAELAISLRQIQRLEAIALDTLSTFLLEAYHIRLEDLKIGDAPEDDASADGDADGADPEPDAAETSPLRKELEWIRESGMLETADMHAFLEQVLDTTAPLLAARGMTAITHQPDSTIEITGNLMALRQGFLNILTALVSALPPGPLHLTVSTEGEQPMVTIQGSGSIGALTGNEERVQLAVELFQIAGGRLELAANAVTITLPSARQLVVLAVDDNVDALSLVSGYLGGTGCKVHGTRDPQSVLAMVQAIRPDVILLDVMMPGVDGWQILGRLKHNPQTAQIPVIISTILPQADLAYSLGADAFLRKPFTQHELAGLISQLTQMALKLP